MKLKICLFAFLYKVFCLLLKTEVLHVDNLNSNGTMLYTNLLVHIFSFHGEVNIILIICWYKWRKCLHHYISTILLCMKSFIMSGWVCNFIQTTTLFTSITYISILCFFFVYYFFNYADTYFMHLYMHSFHWIDRWKWAQTFT